MNATPKYETTSKHLVVSALGFMDAAERLLDPVPHNFLWPPFFVLVSFSFEMSLKAVVRSAGATEKDLKTIGHDLLKALDAAYAVGYREPRGLPLTEVLATLAPLHIDHSLRYFMGDEDRVLDLYEPVDVIAVLKGHCAAVRQHLSSADAKF